MSRDFALLPLDCPTCGAGLAAEADDVVFYCTACHSGHVHRPGAGAGAGLGATPGPLAPVAVTFLAAPTDPVAGHVPFWWLPAKLEMLRRDASGAALRGLVDFFAGREERSGPEDTAFAIPAHKLPLAQTLALATRYTTERPPAGELLGERLTGAVFTPEDAEKLAHYVLIASNVEQSDTLQDLHYDLAFGAPRILGVPWIQQGARRVDAFFGLPV